MSAWLTGSVLAASLLSGAVAGAAVCVQGGSKGMGRAAAECFAADGAKVAVLARTQADPRLLDGARTGVLQGRVLGALCLKIRDELAEPLSDRFPTVS